MVVAIEFIDNIHQQSIILETDSITSCIISTTDLKLNISLSPINKELSKSVYHLSVKANNRKKNSENNSAALNCHTNDDK